MEEAEEKNPWKKLKEERTKVSLDIGDEEDIIGWVMDFTDSAIFFSDVFNKEMFLEYGEIKAVKPYKDNEKREENK